jgi:hypothetical protein
MGSKNLVEVEAHDGGVLLTGAFIAMQSHPFAGRVFTCGRCRRACYHLIHVEDWACRKCQQRRYGLDYRSRHFHRTIPGFNRLIYLRRLISAGPPFSKIASRPQVLADRRRNPPVGIRARAACTGTARLRCSAASRLRPGGFLASCLRLAFFKARTI